MNEKPVVKPSSPEELLAALPPEIVAKMTPPTSDEIRKALDEGERARAAALGAHPVHSELARNLRFR